MQHNVNVGGVSSLSPPFRYFRSSLLGNAITPFQTLAYLTVGGGRTARTIRANLNAVGGEYNGTSVP